VKISAGCLCSVNQNGTAISILDGFVSKVLAGVNVLGTFPSANDIVVPLIDRVTVVVLVDWRISTWREAHGGEKVAEVDNFDALAAAALAAGELGPADAAQSRRCARAASALAAAAARPRLAAKLTRRNFVYAA
jgi:hypothetical protein